MSANTVRNHLVSIFHKACVSTRAELVFAMTPSTPIEPGKLRVDGGRPWSAPLLERPSGVGLR